MSRHRQVVIHLEWEDREHLRQSGRDKWVRGGREPSPGHRDEQEAAVECRGRVCILPAMLQGPAQSLGPSDNAQAVRSLSVSCTSAPSPHRTLFPAGNTTPSPSSLAWGIIPASASPCHLLFHLPDLLPLQQHLVKGFLVGVSHKRVPVVGSQLGKGPRKKRLVR